MTWVLLREEGGHKMNYFLERARIKVSLSAFQGIRGSRRQIPPKKHKLCVRNCFFLVFEQMQVD